MHRRGYTSRCKGCIDSTMHCAVCMNAPMAGCRTSVPRNKWAFCLLEEWAALAGQRAAAASKRAQGAQAAAHCGRRHGRQVAAVRARRDYATHDGEGGPGSEVSCTNMLIAADTAHDGQGWSVAIRQAIQQCYAGADAHPPASCVQVVQAARACTSWPAASASKWPSTVQVRSAVFDMLAAAGRARGRAAQRQPLAGPVCGHGLGGPGGAVARRRALPLHRAGPLGRLQRAPASLA